MLLAANGRVWRRPHLKQQLIAVKRDARRLDRRVVLVTKRGLARAVARFEVPTNRPGETVPSGTSSASDTTGPSQAQP